ncbi:S9 family peptidase [Alteromonas lipolytica]|uniref:S9 family peptidase n=1 Tax=Alteromonas lipolytica TaxID=1856405 RepID=UPI000A9DB624|nr:S9 family peptidase [Alteromonas lipolytica]GGF78945.1 peptidase [Alteromonas lipolytica]
MRIFILLISLSLLGCQATPPANNTPDKSAISASVGLRQAWQGLTRDVIFPVEWQQDSHNFIYRKTVEGGYQFFTGSVSSADAALAFDHDNIATGLSAALGVTVSAMGLPLEHVRIDNDEQRILFNYGYEPWQCSLTTASCQQQDFGRYRPRGFGVVRDLRVNLDDMEKWAGNKEYVAKVEQYNLVIHNAAGEEIFRTSDGSVSQQYDIESVRWSPQNDALVVVRFVPGEARYVTRVEAAPDDQLFPKVVNQLYPKPGDRVDQDQPVLISLVNKTQHDVASEYIGNAYTLNHIYWHKSGNAFSFYFIERGHQAERIITVDKLTAKARVVIEEKADTFIYSWRDFYHDVGNQGEELIWLSERDGWAHLYRYDGRTGKVINQITSGEWPVREVLHVDEQNKQIYFAASGMNKGEDPYFVHYYRINFDGADLTALTPEPANHEVTFSADMAYFVDVYSRVDLPNIAELRRTSDGQLIRVLGKGNIDVLTAVGFKPPTPFVAKGRDGKSDIWGLIVKPTNFDPAKRYPVIENIYAGPHDSFVPKSFWPFGYHSGGDKVIGMQALANLGFIVVQIDGMGTANRSKAFHDVAWQNLGDSGFPDRIKWHQAAAAQFDWYDIADGVGIYGASAGGQSTLGALVFHPDFYTVGVAYAGCYDNRMDKISWNEQWMGYPVGEHYVASSAMEHAGNLQGELLIINGEQDSNVDPASTMQVVDKLVKAGKDFDLLVIPGGGHSVGRSTGPIDYVQRRQFSFFIEKLQRAKVPSWNRATH